ncbi:MAG: hypothetical protein M1814_003236 [Vezdaea aestivalis]|nr:MAG: hypothetical protein M1814_003236 [Vezdaea aestivalis]
MARYCLASATAHTSLDAEASSQLIEFIRLGHGNVASSTSSASEEASAAEVSGDDQAPRKKRKLDSSISSENNHRPFAFAEASFVLGLGIPCPPGLNLPVAAKYLGKPDQDSSLFKLCFSLQGPKLHFQTGVTTSSSLQNAVDHLQLTVPSLLSVSTFFELTARSRIGPVNYVANLLTSNDSATLKITARWDPENVREGLLPNIKAKDSRLLSRFFPFGEAKVGHFWTPQDFYKSVHIPEKSLTVGERYRPVQLQCPLIPFQQRTVRWMLQRENVDISDDGKVVEHAKHDSLPPSFHEFEASNGKTSYISHLFQVLTQSREYVNTFNPSLSGGILAEEMGLGKTIEIIALICLHRRERKLEKPYLDPNMNCMVRPSGATLIVTPSAILQQWKTELYMRVPSLKVTHYTGMPPDLDLEKNEAEIQRLAQQDVVLVTYQVMGTEIHYAQPAPKRFLRQDKRYIPRKSPLAQISWWRVCLDEAQMVESGVSNAAKVARMIPRCNAWAITGTPLRKDVKDLLGLLIFLRYFPFSDAKVWNSLVTQYPDDFRSVFGKITLRNTKRNLGHELKLPPQKRIVFRMPFTMIEEQRYNELFQSMCDLCGFDEDGNALPLPDFEHSSPINIDKMRQWLVRLRQTCLHPEVGGMNRRALGHQNDGPLRTVTEVLEVMIGQSESAVRTEELKHLDLKISRGQLHESIKNTDGALTIWLEALREIEEVVSDCRAQLRIEEKIQTEWVLGENSKDQDERYGLDDYGTRLGVLSNRVRAALEVEHTCVFFVASAYFQKKEEAEPNSPDYQEFEAKETQFYERAKLLRKELLAEVLGKVEGLMAKMEKDRKTSRDPPRIPQIEDVETEGGIEIQKLVDRSYNLFDNLNNQAKVINDWMTKLRELLSERLVDQDEGLETSGEEYNQSAEQQDAVYVYMTALKAILADRNDVLTTGQENQLTITEVKQAIWVANKGEGHSPELLLSLMGVRDEFKPREGLGSVRLLVAEIRALVTNLRTQAELSNRRAAAEYQLADRLSEHTQKVFVEQLKLVSKLESENSLFRQTMNARISYYKQLQQISKQVAPVLAISIDHEVKELEDQEKKSYQTLISLQSKSRYLIHLRQDFDEDSQRTCIICQSTFTVGILTSCGHVYCKPCILAWHKDHRKCPTCKKSLRQTDMTDITYAPKALTASEESEATSSPNASNKIYTSIPSETLNAIQQLALPSKTSFGTKIDTISRQLIYLRDKHPGAKVVIFSQYRDFLAVLHEAFRLFGINAIGFDAPDAAATFISDPTLQAFLLHAKAAASGLTLNAATHVILTEPLTNPAIELQAIARVHRIGQKNETTVWMYLVEGSIEEAVYEISVKKRLAHLERRERAETDEMEREVENADSMALQSSMLERLVDRKGEHVGETDIWECLFRTRRKKAGLDLDERDRAVMREARATAAEARAAQNELQGSITIRSH